MTVSGFYMLYGFEISEEDLAILLEKGIYEKGEQDIADMINCELEDVKCISPLISFRTSPHDEDRTLYIGLVHHVYFGNSKHQDLVLDENDCEVVKKILEDALPEKECTLILIPNDCNCCS